MFGLTFGAAVQTGYEKVWDLPPARWWASWRHVVWLGVLTGYLFVSATTMLRREPLAGGAVASLSGQVCSAGHECASLYGREPSVHEIAKHTGLTEAEVWLGQEAMRSFTSLCLDAVPGRSEHSLLVAGAVGRSSGPLGALPAGANFRRRQSNGRSDSLRSRTEDPPSSLRGCAG